MKVVYVGERSESSGPSIFLAGPSPRKEKDFHWRPEALRFLEEFGFDGQVFVPLKSNGAWLGDFKDQCNWELDHLEKATVIAFWVPRKIEGLPGFTTNVEFGLYVKSGKVVLGYPSEAEKMRYLRLLARRYDVSVFSDLEETMIEAISMASRSI